MHKGGGDWGRVIPVILSDNVFQTKKVQTIIDLQMIDYHMHTTLCKHARGTVEEYVQSAIRQGISEIAFTDHIPLPDEFDQTHRMEPRELDTYVRWIEEMRDAYREIKIRLGIEADYFKGFEDFTGKLLQRYDFDVVIMSVHFLRHWPEGNWVFDYAFPGKSGAEIYSDYIDTLIEGVNSGLFDILGHADLIKKGGDSLVKTIPGDLSRLLAAVHQAGMAVEINTSGFRKTAAESYPGLDWLPLLKMHDVAVTTGSDAHAPEQVGLQFPLIYQALRQAGFETLAGYEKRKRIMIKLDAGY